MFGALHALDCHHGTAARGRPQERLGHFVEEVALTKQPRKKSVAISRPYQSWTGQTSGAIFITMIVEQASATSPVGHQTLAVSYACVILVVFLLPQRFTVVAAGLCCAFTMAISMDNKLKLQPSSVFLLTMASVILNTYTIGYAMPFKYAVVASPLLAMTQAFLTLPFKVIAT